MASHKKQKIYFSQSCDPFSFYSNSVPIKSDFNMEEILRSCPIILAHWKKNPFTLEFDDNNRIIARYIILESDKPKPKE